MSSSNDLRFRSRAPGFLVAAHKRLVLEDLDPAQALRDWIYFFEVSLRYLLFVLDAERAALGLEPSSRSKRVFDQNLCVSLGTMAHGVWGLAEHLQGKSIRLVELVDALNDEGLHGLVSMLLESRNDFSHDDLPEPALAREQVARMRPLLPLLTQALSRIEGTLVAAVGTTPSLTGPRTHLLRESRTNRIVVPVQVLHRRPLLLWPDGTALSLYPGVLMGTRDSFELLWGRKRGEYRVVCEGSSPARWRGDSSEFPSTVSELFEQARSASLLLEGLVAPANQLDHSPDRPRLPAEFEVGEKLGEGGVGSVWEARWGGRRVAVKVLHPSVAADPDAQERFYREAQALEMLKGGGIVRILKLGYAEECGTFVVMEFLGGGDLSTAAPMGAARAAEICLSLLATLHEVHGSGLIHRDVKPTNVLMENQVPHLVDFGIVRDQSRVTITQRQDRLGTPAFWAPEQAAGEDVTAATDLFAVARLLGFLVSNSTERRTQIAQLPTGLQAIYRRATEVSPGRRFQWAEHMLRALEESRKAEFRGSPIHVGALLSSRIAIEDAGQELEGCWLHTVRDEEGERAVVLTLWDSPGHARLKKAAKKAERPVEEHDGLAFVELPAKKDAQTFLSGGPIEWDTGTVAGAAVAAAALGGVALLGAGLAGALLGNKKARGGAAKGLAAALGGRRKAAPARTDLPDFLAGFSIGSRSPAALRPLLARLVLLRYLQASTAGGKPPTRDAWVRLVSGAERLLLTSLRRSDPKVCRLLQAPSDLSDAQLRVVAAWATQQRDEVASAGLQPAQLSPFVVEVRGQWCILTGLGHVPLWG